MTVREIEWICCSTATYCLRKREITSLQKPTSTPVRLRQEPRLSPHPPTQPAPPRIRGASPLFTSSARQNHLGFGSSGSGTSSPVPEYDSIMSDVGEDRGLLPLRAKRKAEGDGERSYKCIRFTPREVPQEADVVMTGHDDIDTCRYVQRVRRSCCILLVAVEATLMPESKLTWKGVTRIIKSGWQRIVRNAEEERLLERDAETGRTRRLPTSEFRKLRRDRSPRSLSDR